VSWQSAVLDRAPMHCTTAGMPPANACYCGCGWTSYSCIVAGRATAAVAGLAAAENNKRLGLRALGVLLHSQRASLVSVAFLAVLE
jgi:hypothetical protein